MLKKILSPEKCASCKFCCSFRRQSLWETPVFDEETKIKLERLYPGVTFRKIDENSPENACSDTKNKSPQNAHPTPETNSSKTAPASRPFFTIDLSSSYKTQNPDEEALCPFLKNGSGCILPPELKPFDCSIWPFRIIRKKDNTLWLVLTPTCREINLIPLEEIKAFAREDLLAPIKAYVKNHPEIIKEDSSFFVPLFSL